MQFAAAKRLKAKSGTSCLVSIMIAQVADFSKSICFPPGKFELGPCHLRLKTNVPGAALAAPCLCSLVPSALSYGGDVAAPRMTHASQDYRDSSLPPLEFDFSLP